jgi:hypothetical protein
MRQADFARARIGRATDEPRFRDRVVGRTKGPPRDESLVRREFLDGFAQAPTGNAPN